MGVKDSQSEAYSVRYCAFVDILGFSGVINELRRGTIDHEQLRKILGRVHRPTPYRYAPGVDNLVRAQSISDAVCLSAPPSPKGLRELLHNLDILTENLLEYGYLARGAVVKGPLYHDDQMVFGSALVEAYRLESQIALYPRIMISKPVAQELYSFSKDDPSFSDFVRQADDGPFFLHVLRILDIIAEQDRENALGLLEKYTSYAALLQKRLDTAVDEPRHFQKVQWFSRYWNSVVHQFAGEVPKIIGPGLK